jgi:hypothetical protein
MGGPRVLAARFFKCSKIRRITRSRVMKERIRIGEPHWGHTRGSVWYTLLIKSAHRRRSLDAGTKVDFL